MITVSQWRGSIIKVALIAAPFIAILPTEYGGTELFVAHLAEGLRKGSWNTLAQATSKPRKIAGQLHGDDIPHSVERTFWFSDAGSDGRWHPVLALPGGSVADGIQEGVSDHICRSIRELCKRVETLNLSSSLVRQHVEQNFSIDDMVTGYIQLYEEVLKNGQTTLQAKRECRFGLGQQ